VTRAYAWRVRGGDDDRLLFDDDMAANEQARSTRTVTIVTWSFDTDPERAHDQQAAPIEDPA
jgi:hypothetical protein